ncbi:MAG: hypothetical protein ABR573_06410 [Candidatus Dormibacteria bacterium]
MKLLRATVAEVIGLFVGDWSQALGILIILALGYAAVRATGASGLGFVIVLALAGHLVWTTIRASRPR